MMPPSNPHDHGGDPVSDQPARCCYEGSIDPEDPSRCDCAPWCDCQDCGHPPFEAVPIVLPVTVTLEDGQEAPEEVLIGLRDGAGRDVLLFDPTDILEDEGDEGARQQVADLQVIAAALNARDDAEAMREEARLGRRRYLAEAVVRRASRLVAGDGEDDYYSTIMRQLADAKRRLHAVEDAQAIFYAKHPELLAEDADADGR